MPKSQQKKKRVKRLSSKRSSGRRVLKKRRGRPPKDALRKKVLLSISIPQSLRDRLDTIASLEERSKSAIVRLALKNYLERIE